MDDKRNILLAVLLTGIILFGWPLVIETFFPEQAQKNETVEQANDPANDQRPVDGDLQIGSPDDGIAELSPQAEPDPRAIAQAAANAPRVAIDTPRVEGSINLAGARIDDLTLTDHRVSQDADAPAVRLFAPAGSDAPYFAQFGWTGQGADLPTADTVWRADGDRLAPGNPVTLSWSNGSGQLFRIQLSIDDDYLITAEQSVANRGGAPVAVKPFALVSRVYDEDEVLPSDQDSWTIHSGPIGVFDGTADFGTDYDDVVDAGSGGVAVDAANGWIGFSDKYWLAALIPPAGAAVDAKFRAGSGDVYQAQVARDEATLLAPGKVAGTTMRLFAGAKETVLLDEYKASGITLFDRAIDWGWFYWFEKPIFYLLHWLFELVGNFGVAIIIMTFIVRLVMFPIAQKGFASMAQMRAVQPKMKKLQTRYKDDKPKLQQEMMKLYKDEKVSPLSGCLPMLLQIPIFFALYKVLMLSIEMRHQPFALWIKDLSAPDPLTPVNLFGLIPFDPPTFLAIGVLPILMGITMHFQFKLNPQQMEPIQQQIFSFMPWVLVFIMAPFAAGLQLYWVVSNILTIAQQKWLYSRHPQLQRMMAEEAAEKERERASKEGAAKA